MKKADIIAVRPSGEEYSESIAQIWSELRSAGLDFGAEIQDGITQPDGSKVFNVYLGEDAKNED